MTNARQRFVVLRHEFADGSERSDHFDLMLKVEDVLWTWALPEWPGENMSLESRRLEDHRIAYLQFEGDISDDRGTVKRILAGSFRFIDKDDEKTTVELFLESKIPSETESFQLTIENTPADHDCMIQFDFYNSQSHRPKSL